jgi:RNA polymerase sigma-70 factor (ECF subfamily)
MVRNANERGWHVNETVWLAERFEDHRSHLRSVAYRMLGSLAEADDAVQEAWLRLARSEAGGIENLRGWLTTVVARVPHRVGVRHSRRERSWMSTCPTQSSRSTRRPVGGRGVARRLGRARTADRSRHPHAPGAARVRAARYVLRSVQRDRRDRRAITGFGEAARESRWQRAGGRSCPTPISRGSEAVVDAFLAAARDGDFDGLLEVLDPDVVLRADSGALPHPLAAGARARVVAQLALTFSDLAHSSRPALVNGAAGSSPPGGRVFSVLAVTIKHDRIVEIDILADPERLTQLDLVLPDVRSKPGS